MAVIAAWENQGCKSRALSCIMKEIFSHVSTYNIDLHLKYVPSCLNEADAPSRLTNTADSMLSEESWLLVESLYGPHSVDLMSLDSNVMKSSTGVPLKHFTPWPTPCSAGVNLFSQNLRSEQNPYVYPPFVLVFPVLSLLREQGISCTIIVPEMRPLPIWWPILKYYSVESGADIIIDWQAINDRTADLDERMTSSSDYKRKNSLFETFLCFLEKSPKKPSLATCGPNDVRNFLVWKDKFGKTTVHDINCQYLGLKGMFECSCPNRLASATVEGLINQLVNLFDDKGLGRTWCDVERKGNPAVSPVIKEYLKLVQVEQAKAHILPKQAKPIFLTKIRSISAFISRELQKDGSKLKEKFVLYRDQAWFKLQYFAGDRASDLSIVVAQEVKFLKDGSGFVFQHTFGKTLRGFILHPSVRTKALNVNKCNLPNYAIFVVPD
ncbi:Hypothetical predicted protein [Mytilus galloprovincialis]|uniref:ALOG domain-containing protein n=1 Tax=Mytilus galloprovincialis TaxID=29158 RepID=A0A8B6DT67_MYTGA|nr:Hypothetical predicted protein [Mytilus galloprovincialis]